MKKKKTVTLTQILWLIGFFILCYGIAYISGIATKNSLTPWYSHLAKPAWNPPDWVFAPVWTILYFMIALSGWIIFLAKKSHTRSWALFFYVIQLLLNGLWSFFFFYYHKPLLSLVDIILLNIFIALTIGTSWRVSKKGALLLVPYFLWTLYALTLNAAIVYLN